MKKILMTVFVLGLVLIPSLGRLGLVRAQDQIITNDPLAALGDINDQAEFSEQGLTDTIGLLISVLLGVLGIIFLVLVIWAGLLWMTAAGETKQTQKAKDILVTSVIGLVILLSAYAISTFVIDNITNATSSAG